MLQQTLLKIFILYVSNLYLIYGLCELGCQSCDDQLKCTQCYKDYKLDQGVNKCIYSQCDSDLFFQIKQDSQNQNIGTCQAVCDNEYYHNLQQNVCVKFEQCSLQYSSQQVINRGDFVKDIIPYGEEFILVIYSNFINQINRLLGKYEQTLFFTDDIAQLITIQKYIIVQQSNMQVLLWDIEQGRRIYLTTIDKKDNFDKIILLNVDNTLGFSVSVINNQQDVYIQHIFSALNPEQAIKQKSFTLSHDVDEDLLFFNDLIIHIKTEEGIRISQIILNQNFEVQVNKILPNFICKGLEIKKIKQISRINKESFLILPNSGNSPYVINKQDCTPIDSQSNKFDSPSKKFDILRYNNQIFLFIQFENKILIVDSVGQKIQQQQPLDKLDSQITDFILYNEDLGENPKIYVLQSNQVMIELELEIQNNEIVNKQNNKQIKQIKVQIKNPSKLIIVQDNQLKDRLFITSNEIQAITIDSQIQIKDTVQTQAEMPEYVIKNFELKEESVYGIIQNTILLENTNTLVSCTQDGLILVWDISNFYDGIFLGSYQIKNQECLDISQYSDSDVIGIFSRQIILFNVFSMNITQQIFESNSKDIKPIIAQLNKQLIFIIDSTLYYYDNIQQNNTRLTFNEIGTDIVNMFLENDNFMIIQRNTTIEKYLIDTSSKIVTFTEKKLKFPSGILLTKIKKYQSSTNNQSNIKFEVVLYTRDRSFVFLNDDLSQTFIVSNIPISEVYDINFVQSIPSDKVYFIMGKTIKKTAFQTECYAIQKGTDGYNLAFDVSTASKILEPYRYQDSNAQPDQFIYDVKVTQNLSYYSAIISFTYDAYANTFFDELTQLQGILGAKFTSTQNKKYLECYDNKGFVGSNIQRRQYYKQSFQLSSLDKKNEDQIVSIQQSYRLEKYFIIKRSILVMNIHTNEQIEEIIFEKDENNTIKEFIILEKESIIIAYKSSQIKVKNFLLNETYSYSNNINIKGLNIIERSEQQQIFIYGNKIISLTLDLNLTAPNNNIYQPTIQVLFCNFTSTNIICKLEDSKIYIFDYSNLKNPKTPFQPKSLNNEFLMTLDEDNDRLFLYTDSIEVYGLKGVFKNIIEQSSGIILNFYFFGKNIVFNSNSTITVLDRQTLANRGQFQPSGGGNLLKIIFVQEYNHLLVCGDVLRFAQIFIYSLDTFVQVTNIKNTYVQNGVRQVIDMKYDKNNNILVYLDEVGNFFIIDYSGGYSQTNMLTIRELHTDLTTSPLGISLDFDMNNLFIYNKEIIYQTNYAGLTNSYKKQQYYLNDYFVKIPKQEKNKETFIFVGTGNILYSYDQYNFSYFAHLDSQDPIKGIQFIKNNNLLIIAQDQELKIFKVSSVLIDLGNNINTLNGNFIQGYKFYQFLCDGIFLTADKKIIHYNFETRKQVREVQIGQEQRIISHLYVEQLSDKLSALLCGFNDGTLLIYDLLSEKPDKIKYLTINPLNQVQNKIRYIYEEKNYIWVASINSQILKIKKSSLEEETRYDFLPNPTNISYEVHAFAVDEQNQRVFINYLGEKYLRIIDLNNPQQDKPKILSFPNTEFNRIKFTENKIILYSTAQLNIHQRDNLIFLYSIRRQNNVDEIIQFFIFSEKYFLIQFQQKIELIQVDYENQDFQLLDQIKVNGLIIIKALLDSLTNILRVIGIQKNQLFDQSYSLSYYDQLHLYGNQQCSLNIKGQTYLEMTQTLSIIKPLYQSLPTLLGLSIIPDSSLNKYLTIYLDSEDLTQINFQATSSSQLTIVPLIEENSSNKNEIKDLNINQDTFKNFLKNDLLLKNFAIKFNPKQNQIITQNKQIQKIYIQNININDQTLNNIQVSFNNTELIIINKITINNLKIVSTESLSFIRIENCSSIYIKDMEINNLTLDGIGLNFLTISNSNIIEINHLKIIDSKVSNFTIFEMVQELTINDIEMINCSSFLLPNSQTSLIKYFFFQFLGINNIFIKNVQFEENKELLFSVSDKQIKRTNITIIYNEDLFKLQNANFTKNFISGNDSVSLFELSSTNIILDQVRFIDNNANIKFIGNKQVEISNSNFTKNIGLYGGALSFYNTLLKINISNTEFINNKALSSGGAIYCEEINGTITIDKQTKINQNQALIGGGIRIYNINTRQFSQDLKNLLIDKIIQNNSADLYGNDYATFLQYIKVNHIYEDLGGGISQPLKYQIIPKKNLTDQEQKKFSGKLMLENIRSGSAFSFSIQVFDSEGSILKYSKEKYKNGTYPLQISDEISQIYFNLENNDQSKFIISGSSYITAEKYEQQDHSFQFKDFQITSIPETVNSISFTFQINPLNTSTISITIQYRNCEIGEIIKYFTKDIFSCQPCSEGTYSLLEPVHQQTATNTLPINKTQTVQNYTNSTSADSVACKKCPNTAVFCKGKTIQLKDGYWRSDDLSQDIFYCENSPKNCIPEKYDNMFGCIKGSFGPLCEECDGFGEIWQNKSYTRSFTSHYFCVECSQLTYQTVFIILVLLAITVYALVSVIMFMNSFQYTQTCYYLRLMEILPISKNSIKDQSSFYLKILLNYLQISSLVIYFNEELFPDIVLNGIQIFQAPTNKIVASTDCLTNMYANNRDRKLKVILILYISLPFLIFILLRGLISILSKLFKQSIKINHKFTLLNFLFVLFQPSQVIYYTQSLSCREIGSFRYKALDISMKCEDSNEDKFTFAISVTMLLIWVIAPFIFWYLLKRRQNSLQTCNTRYRFGYFYSEFKNQYYFWEFIRLTLRISIVTTFTLLKSNNIQITFILLVIIISIYIKLILTFNPIYSNQLQKSEILSLQVIVTNILLSAMNQQFQLKQIDSAIYAVHIIFMIYIIWTIIFFKINSRQNLVGRIIRWLLSKILTEKQYKKITKGNTVNFEVFTRWKKIRQNLTIIIGFYAIDKAKNISINKNQQMQGQKGKYLQTEISSFFADISKQANIQLSIEKTCEKTQDDNGLNKLSMFKQISTQLNIIKKQKSYDLESSKSNSRELFGQNKFQNIDISSDSNEINEISICYNDLYNSENTEQNENKNQKIKIHKPKDHQSQYIFMKQHNSASTAISKL